MDKYGEYGSTYEDLLKRVVNLEDDLPIPYEEAMNDIITWKSIRSSWRGIFIRSRTL